MNPLLGAALIGAGGNFLGGLFGGDKEAKLPRTPEDLRGQRRNVIGLQNYLLGFNQPGTPWSPQQQQQDKQAARGGQPGTAPGQGGSPWPGVNAGMNGGGQSPWGGVNGGMSATPQGIPGMQQAMTQWGGGANQGMFGQMSDPIGSRGPNTGAGMPTSAWDRRDPGQTGGALPSFGQIAGSGLYAGAPGQGQNPVLQGGGAQSRPFAGAQANSQMDFMGGGGATQFMGPQANGLQRVGGGQPILQGQGLPQGGGYQNPTYGMQPGGGFSSQMPQTQPNNPMLGRMESYFGPLGTPTTALQQQSLGGISQFLNSNPYGQSNTALQGIMGGQGYGEANQAYRNIGSTNFGGAASGAFGQAGDMFQGVGGQNLFGGAQQGFNQLANGQYFNGAEGAFNRLENYNPFGAAQGSMEQILASNPGMQGMAALQPLLQRNLAAANQEGGRFGSANAILRSRAVDDNNMLAAQMYQRGVDQQIGAAGQYGQMGSSLLGARAAAGQGLLGVGQGRMQQQTNAAQGQLGVGQGRLSQGLGAAQGMLGVGQGQLGVGQLGLQGALGSAGGLGELAMALQGNRLDAAGQMATNQNALFGNMTSAYDTGHRQAAQEAERQQQALAILLSQLGVAEQSSLQGRG
jgi:hypothetical protein